MGKSKTTPLARGLIGGKTSSIYCQLEVFLVNNKKIKIVINRKPYGGKSDISFSIGCSDLLDLLEVLDDAQAKLDEFWLSRMAIRELDA